MIMPFHINSELVNNAFNSTNSVTGSNTLYNMDLDIYNIQNNISVGDTSANISLTSSQDYVMINAIVTKLNSQLPDLFYLGQTSHRLLRAPISQLDFALFQVCTF